MLCCIGPLERAVEGRVFCIDADRRLIAGRFQRLDLGMSTGRVRQRDVDAVHYSVGVGQRES